MEDLEYDFDGAGTEDDFVSVIVGIFHLVGIVFFFWYCCLPKRCRRCGRRESEPEPASADAPFIASAGQLQPKKRVLTTYVLWLSLGFLGAHHFYLGRVFHGVFAAWSCNFCGTGWVVDAVMIPVYVRRFNDKYTAANAPHDASRRKLCQMPLALCALLGACVGAVVYTPWLLHASGVVDIDRIAAQTAANPYELLGLSQGSSLAEAKQAYRRESLKWHPDRNLGCGKECEQRMYDITRAFELIKKRRAPPPPDRTWGAWVQDVGSDWLHIMEVLAQQEEEYQRQEQQGDNAAHEEPKGGEASSERRSEL